MYFFSSLFYCHYVPLTICVVVVVVAQEAFFGKDLLDKSKQSRQRAAGPTGLLEDGQGQADGKPPRGANSSSFLDPSSDPLLSASAAPLTSRPPGARTYTPPSVYIPRQTPASCSFPLIVTL